MQISIIVAMSQNNVIGINNALPWRLPADLKYFKEQTMYKPIVMGRKTFDSIGRALPNRQNIVLTRDDTFEAENIYTFHDIDSVIKECSKEKEVMVIGGANIYEQFLPLVSRLYITEVDVDLPGDTSFPSWDRSEWNKTQSEQFDADDKNQYPYSFNVYERT